MRGFASIGLQNPKFSCNVGEVLRAAGCFDVSLVCVAGHRYKKSSTDTQSAHRHIPLITGENLRDLIPFGAIPVAVDIVPKAQELGKYIHPESAFYIFGPEDGTLGENVLGFCKDFVYVPTKFCMNLAATVNVVLYDRLVKIDKYHSKNRDNLC